MTVHPDGSGREPAPGAASTPRPKSGALLGIGQPLLFMVGFWGIFAAAFGACDAVSRAGGSGPGSILWPGAAVAVPGALVALALWFMARRAVSP